MQVLEYAVSFVGFMSGRYFDNQPVHLVAESELIIVDKNVFLPHQLPEEISPGCFEDGVWFSDPRDSFSGIGLLLTRPFPEKRACIAERLRMPGFTVIESRVGRDLLRPIGDLVDRICDMSCCKSVLRQLNRGGSWDAILRMPANCYDERGYHSF